MGMKASIARSFFTLLLISLVAAGCAEHGSESWTFVPKFAITRSNSLFDRLLADPGSLQDKLNDGLSVNACGPSGHSFASRAIGLGRHESLRVLVAYGADLGTLDPAGHSPWYHAIKSSDTTALEIMVRSPSSERAAPGDLASAVSALAQAGGASLEAIVPLLIRAPVDWNAAGPNGNRTADVLLNHGQEATALQLLSAAAAPLKVRLDTIERFLAKGGNLETLLRAQLDPDLREEDGRSLLSVAISAKNVSAVNSLLEFGAKGSVGFTSQDPIVIALLSGQTGVALELLKRGVDPGERRAELSAADAADLMLDEKFLAVLAKTEPSSGQALPPYLAAELRNRLGGTPDRWTPQVTSAVKSLQRELGVYPHGYPTRFVESFLEGMTARSNIASAAGSGDVAFFDELPAGWAEYAKQPDVSGWTPLMYAAVHGHAEVVKKLLQLKVPTSTRDKMGSNALLLALLSDGIDSQQREQVVTLLVRAGTPNDTNNKGIAPSDVAARYATDGAPAVYQKLANQVASVQGFVAVLGRPGAKAWGYNCGKNIPSKWVKERWDAGLEIEQLARFGTDWCVVMGRSNNRGRGEGYYFVKTQRDWDEAMRDMKKNGHSIVDVETLKGTRVLIGASPMRGSTNSLAWMPEEDLGGFIDKQVWEKGWKIEEVGAWEGSWGIVYGAMRGLTRQRYSISRNFEDVLVAAKQGWQEGFHITSLASKNGRWFVVLSKGSGLKDQKLVVARERTEFWSRVDDHMKAGWRINHLAAENLR